MPSQIIYIGEEKIITKIRKHLCDALDLKPREKQPMLGTVTVYNGDNMTIRIGATQTLIGDKKHVEVVAKYYGAGVKRTDHALSLHLVSGVGDLSVEFGRGPLWHSLVRHLHDKFNPSGSYTTSIHKDVVMYFQPVDFDDRAAMARAARKKAAKSDNGGKKIKKKKIVKTPKVRRKLKRKK